MERVIATNSKVGSKPTPFPLFVFTQSIFEQALGEQKVETTIAMLRRAMLSCAYACTKQDLIQSGFYDLVCDVLKLPGHMP